MGTTTRPGLFGRSRWIWAALAVAGWVSAVVLLAPLQHDRQQHALVVRLGGVGTNVVTAQGVAFSVQRGRVDQVLIPPLGVPGAAQHQVTLWGTSHEPTRLDDGLYFGSQLPPGSRYAAPLRLRINAALPDSTMAESDFQRDWRAFPVRVAHDVQLIFVLVAAGFLSLALCLWAQREHRRARNLPWLGAVPATST